MYSSRQRRNRIYLGQVAVFNMHIFSSLALVTGLAGAVQCSADIVRTTIDEAPVLANSDQVQFFILESSFPFNAPDGLKTTAGNLFQKFYVTHAGLGVWDINTGEKFSIEFISENYLGALLPTVNTTTNEFAWQNSGNIVVTIPTNFDNWLGSQLVCVSSGTAYNQLISYMQNHQSSFATYQPVEVIYYNTTYLETAASDQVASPGDILVPKTDSFWFVNQLINELSTYGTTVAVYMDVYATAFQYLSFPDAAPAVVTWSAQQSVPKDVLYWYSDLTVCYHQAYANTQGAVLGGITLMENLQPCYGDYAYVYRDPYSVYNVSLLGNRTQAASTPKLTKFVFQLLDDGTGGEEVLQTVDYVLIAIVFVGLVIGVSCVLRRICRAPVRRRVSMDGEMVAVRTVNKIDEQSQSGKSNKSSSSHGGTSYKGGDGATASEDDVIQSYYRTKSEDAGIMLSLRANTTNVASGFTGLFTSSSNNNNQSNGNSNSNSSSNLKGLADLLRRLPSPSAAEIDISGSSSGATSKTVPKDGVDDVSQV